MLVNSKEPGINTDGSIKDPISALCGILHHCGVRKVRLIPQDLHALILNILRNRLNFDFLRDHQTLIAQKI